MTDTLIAHHDDLPLSIRSLTGSYPYLHTHHFAYWRHAVDVAHQLLSRFREQHADDPSKTYYQDDFRTDFLAELTQTDLHEQAQMIGQFELNQSLRGAERDKDPNWIGYREAAAKLKSSPRGTAIVYKSIYDGGSHWEATVSCGGGNLSGCSTMKKGQGPATLQAIWQNLLGYEGYLARRQAETEQLILKNYARIHELKLRVGLRLQDVEVDIEYKPRKLRFVVLELLENGMLKLGEGKMHGSRKMFEATINAIRITETNLSDQSDQPTTIVPRCEATLELF